MLCIASCAWPCIWQAAAFHLACSKDLPAYLGKVDPEPVFPFETLSCTGMTPPAPAQGDIESVAAMNPKELTVLFEAVSGSEALRREYEEAQVRITGQG